MHPRLPAPQHTQTGPGRVLCQPHRDLPFQALVDLYATFARDRYDAVPEILPCREMEAADATRMASTFGGILPGERYRVLVGLDDRRLEIHPLSERDVTLAWERIERAVCDLREPCNIELTPTVFWVTQGTAGVVAWEGHGEAVGILLVDVLGMR